MKNLMDLNFLDHSMIDGYLSELARVSASSQNELIQVRQQLDQAIVQMIKIQQNEAAARQAIAMLKQKMTPIYANFERCNYLEWDVKLFVMVNKGQHIASQSVDINSINNLIIRSPFLCSSITSPARGLLSVIEYPSGSKLTGEKVLIGYITPID
jgi:hypothetical protein